MSHSRQLVIEVCPTCLGFEASLCKAPLNQNRFTYFFLTDSIRRGQNEILNAIVNVSALDKMATRQH